MEGMSLDDLAVRAGVSVSEIERLISLGILGSAGAASHFRPADVQKIRLALACEEGGLPVDGIGTAIAAGQLSFAFLEADWYQQFPPVSARTLSDVASEYHLAVDVVARILEAFGYVHTTPDDPLREDELDIVAVMGVALSNGAVDEAAAVRFGRAIADSLRRIAQAGTEVYHDGIEVPLLRSGLSQRETMERASALSDLYTEPLEKAVVAVYRHQQEVTTVEHLVEHIETALEDSGLYRKPDRPAAMSFVDLEGYTRLTEERGDEEATRVADVLAAVVERQMGRFRGQTVKWLGDGVMSYFRDPADAVIASLELVEAVPKAGLPPAHAGVAAGPVVVQAGDYFGRTVNAAARISAVAVGGQVLVDEVVTETPPEGVRFRDVGIVELKGLKPRRLFEACRVGRNP